MLSNYKTILTIGDHTVYRYEGRYYLRYKECTYSFSKYLKAWLLSQT
jgi:hypothetical protein